MPSADDYWDESPQQQSAAPAANRPPVTRRNRELAGLAHVVGVFAVTFPVPLFIWLTGGRKSPFVKRHAKEALNFQLNVLFWLAAMITLVVYTKDLVPEYGNYFFLVPVMIYLIASSLCLLAGYMSSISEEYRYPMIFRLFR
jgi:uncharacterized Tic20 family protein